MSSRPWMPWYVAEFVADTQHLDAAQTGAYMMLIGHYWQHGGLPDSDAALARIARMSRQQWSSNKDTLKAFFDACWKHKRVDEELRRQAELSSKRKAAALQKHSNSSANAQQLHTQLQSQSQEDDGGGNAVAQNAFEIATELLTICGHSPDFWPPGWCGSPQWVQKCLNEGWLPEIMIAETRAVVGRKRDGPIENFKYLEKPLARAHAQHLAPLPKVEIQQETIRGTYSTTRDNDFKRALGRLAESIGEDSGGEEMRPPSPRLLPDGGRE